MVSGLSDFPPGTYALSSKAEFQTKVVCFRSHTNGIDSLVGGDR